jgi:hypothetical protein
LVDHVKLQKDLRDDLAPELPEELLTNDLELSWRIWQWLEITGWRWPPTVLLDQPDWLMDDLLTISAMNGKVRKLYDS